MSDPRILTPEEVARVESYAFVPDEDVAFTRLKQSHEALRTKLAAAEAERDEARKYLEAEMEIAKIRAAALRDEVQARAEAEAALLLEQRLAAENYAAKVDECRDEYRRAERVEAPTPAQEEGQ